MLPVDLLLISAKNHEFFYQTDLARINPQLSCSCLSLRAHYILQFHRTKISDQEASFLHDLLTTQVFPTWDCGGTTCFLTRLTVSKKFPRFLPYSCNAFFDIFILSTLPFSDIAHVGEEKDNRVCLLCQCLSPSNSLVPILYSLLLPGPLAGCMRLSSLISVPPNFIFL